jgi:hypothetical protein
MKRYFNPAPVLGVGGRDINQISKDICLKGALIRFKDAPENGFVQGICYHKLEHSAWKTEKQAGHRARVKEMWLLFDGPTSDVSVMRQSIPKITKNAKVYDGDAEIGVQLENVYAGNTWRQVYRWGKLYEDCEPRLYIHIKDLEHDHDEVLQFKNMEVITELCKFMSQHHADIDFQTDYLYAIEYLNKAVESELMKQVGCKSPCESAAALKQALYDKIDAEVEFSNKEKLRQGKIYGCSAFSGMFYGFTDLFNRRKDFESMTIYWYDSMADQDFTKTWTDWKEMREDIVYLNTANPVSRFRKYVEWENWAPRYPALDEIILQTQGYAGHTFVQKEIPVKDVEELWLYVTGKRPIEGELWGCKYEFEGLSFGHVQSFSGASVLEQVKAIIEPFFDDNLTYDEKYEGLIKKLGIEEEQEPE